MKTSVQITADKPKQLQEAVGPSLRSHNTVEYSYRTEEDIFQINVEAEGLGPLRGATDSVFRLASLSQRLR